MKSIKIILSCLLIFLSVPAFSQTDSLNNELLKLDYYEQYYYYKNYRNFNPIIDLIEKGADINIKNIFGNTLLHEAVEKNKLELVQLLVYKGINTKIINNENLTAFQIAENKNRKKIIEFLKKKKFDRFFYTKYGSITEAKENIENNISEINKPDKYGFTLLDYAIGRQKNAVELLNYLTEKGADINFSYIDVLDIAIQNENLELVKKYSAIDTLRKNIRPLNVAIETHNLELVKLLIEKGANFNKPDYLNLLPFNIVFRKKQDNKEIIRYLVDEEICIHTKDWDKRTILHHLCLDNNLYYDFDYEFLYEDIQGYSDVKLVKSVIDKGVDIEAVDNENKTALHYAAQNPDAVETLKYLLKKGANQKASDNGGYTPFKYAIFSGNCKAIKIFLEHDEDINTTDEYENTLLHTAVLGNNSGNYVNYLLRKGLEVNAENSFNFVKFLLDKDLDVNAKNSSGETPLHLASKFKNNSNTIKLLIQSGAEVNIADKYKSTPLLNAVLFENFETVKLLVESGANMEINNSYSENILEIALKKNFTETAKYLINKGADLSKLNLVEPAKHNNIEILKLLISKGVNANIKDKGNAPIIITALNGFKEATELLINSGADINISDSNYKSAILAAISNNNPEIAKILIDIGADLKRRSAKTPLHYAAEHKNGYKIAELLIEKGVNVNALDDNHMTPLNYALKNNNINTVNLIKAQIDRDKKKTVIKNSFSNDRMVIYDRIPLDTLHYKESNDSGISFLDDLYYESENFNNIDFNQKFYDKISSEKITGYSDFYPYMSPLKKANIFNPPLSLEVINNRLGATIETGFDIDPETGDLIKRIYQNEACLWEIDGIMFYVNWIFDEDNYTFEKEVLSYSPIRRYFSDEMLESRYSLISFIDFERYQNKKDKKKIKKRAKLFKKVKYEFLIHELSTYLTDKQSSDKKIKSFYKRMNVGEKTKESPYERDQIEKEKSPYWTSINREKIVESIFSRVISDKSNAYDFETGELLSLDKIYKRMGAENDTVYDIDPYSGETIPIINEKNINLDEIKSVIFIEDWYLDEETLQIVKEVIGIAPVKDAVKPDDHGKPNSVIDDWLVEDGKENEPTKTIPFVVYFKDMNQNAFDEKRVSVTTPVDNNYMTFNSGILNKHFYFLEKNTPNINFKEFFINKVINGDVKLYMNFSYNENKDFDQNSYKIIDTTEILSRIGISYDTIQTYDANGETVEELVKSKGYGIDSISVIRSHEEWTFDADNFKFYKNVISYSPAVRFYREDDIDCDDPRNKLIGYVLNKSEGKSHSNMTLFKKIKYEFGDMNLEKDLLTDIPNIEDEKPLFWNSYNQKTFKECILKIASSGNINSYDFNSGKKLSSPELKQNLILSTDTVYDIDPDSGETIQLIVNNTIDYTSINSFIFIENHYIDEKNLNLKKEVVGIAPVVYFISDPETKKYKKVIPFVLYFDESKRF